MALKLHLVPHTHWDREWYLPLQTFRIRLVHLMDRLLDVLDQDRAFRHFMLDGQTIVLDDYVEIRPEREKQLAQFVSWGRLSIGPWHVLPDEFLVSGESLVRNLMQGDRVARRFGDKMDIGYVPDPFGHIAQLPQILRGFGIEAAVFRRGLAEEPVELWWDAPDGSRVSVSYLRDSYDNAARLPTTDPDAFVTAIRVVRDSLAPYTITHHVLLMAGTDHHEAQVELPQLIEYANAGRLGSDRLVHSSLGAYIEAMREAVHKTGTSLPVVTGELRSPQRHHLLPGVLSTRMWIKQRNDAVETLLTRWVEPFTAWAELLEAELPAKPGPVHLTGHEPLGRVGHPNPLVWRAWRFLLENHPHDSICGCSIDQVHREMGPRFDQAEQIGAEITRQSLTAIADHVDTCFAGDGTQGPGAPQPLVVFNPAAGPRTDAVTVRVRLPGSPDAIEVVGPDGRPLPFQVQADSMETERDLFHMDVPPDALAMYVGMVAGGRLFDYIIHDVQLRQLADAVEILVLLSESGEPDYPRLDGARSEVEALIRGGQVSRFSIRALVAEMHDLVFIAPGVSGYGYATFTVRQRQKPDAGGRRRSPAPNTIENDLIRLEANTADGTLTLTDKTTGAVYAGLNHFVDGGDRGDEYNYCLPAEDRLVARPVDPPSIRLMESGPARFTLEISQV
jgi:alpha-mannosidase